LPWTTAADIEQRVLTMTSNGAHVSAGSPVVADWVAVRGQRPVSASNALRQLLAAMRYRAPPAAPRSAVLLLASRHDRLVSSRCSEAIATAWRVPLKMHSFAGHDLALDDAGWVIEQVLAWVAEADGERGGRAGPPRDLIRPGP